MLSLVREFKDQNDIIPQLGKRIAKWALVGVFTGLSVNAYKGRSNFARRMMATGSVDLKSTLRILAGEVKQPLLSGVSMGFAFWFIHDWLSPKFFHNQERFRYRLSHAMMAYVIAFTFINPVYFVRSLIIGTIWGDLRYIQEHGFNFPNGFYVDLPGPTEKERLNQR